MKVDKWNILCVMCTVQDSSHLYLVMDFHPGGDLLSVMERNEGGMSESDARSVIWRELEFLN